MFWNKLKRPFFVLAPMADVTDSAFRQIVLSCGKPDVLFTEFVSCDGLCSEKGRLKLLPHLIFNENERPIVAQFFGSNPENFYKCAQLATEFGFDGIDINMGCPDRRVMKQGGGAALILKPELAKEIIKETKRGASSTGSGRTIPVSVKTRLGYNKIATGEWLSHLIDAEPAAITVHGRTAKEMSKVPADWDEIGKAAILCHKANITVVGNGDVMTRSEGLEKAKQYGLDGIMIGRGVFSNPWFFSAPARGGSAYGGKGIKSGPASGGNDSTKTPKERIALMKKHIELFTELWGKDKHFDVMKKFFKIYISGWEGAKELRMELMKTKNKREILSVVKAFDLNE